MCPLGAELVRSASLLAETSNVQIHIMGPLAAVIVAVGIIAVIYALFTRRKASRITNSQHMPTGSAASQPANKAVSVQGHPVANPLVSPVTGRLASTTS